MSESALLAHDLARGVRLIAGVDEVGRACLAGPIMAAGVLFDLERLSSGPGRDLLDELNDSKRLTRAKRERLAAAVLTHAEVVSLASLSASEIDRIGIQDANQACLRRALRGVGERAELCLVDGELALGPEASAHELIVHGDGTSATIAAASIVAKVARDRLMTRMGERYPDYGFARHKGYSTKAHRAVVAELGPTPLHRLSFDAPCYAEIRRFAGTPGAARPSVTRFGSSSLRDIVSNSGAPTTDRLAATLAPRGGACPSRLASTTSVGSLVTARPAKMRRATGRPSPTGRVLDARGFVSITLDRAARPMSSSDLPLKTPAGLLGLMRLPGVGPAKALAHARGEETLDELDEDSLRRAIESASAQVGEYEKAGVVSLGQFDAGFPTGLSTIPGAPAVVFVRGEHTAWERPALAVVGTRSPSSFGEETTRSLTCAAVEIGFSIISGLALGIDATAHVAALDAGGRTTAVLGSGLDSITPKQHGRLADRILRSDGALLSEQPFETAPSARTLVARNRLQAGLAQAVLVGEAGIKSGTMHTVRFAAEQGKPIYCAVPPAPRDESAGLIALLETPAQALPSVLPAWAKATALAARLGSSPLARPVSSNEVEAWLLRLKEDARSAGSDVDGGPANDDEEQLRLNGV